MLEHLDDDAVADASRTWRRVLVPGGRALVATPDPAGPRARDLRAAVVGYADPTHVNLKPHAYWRDCWSTHGFAVLREGSDGLWNVPYGRGTARAMSSGRPRRSAQYLAGRLVLPPGSGESSVFVIRAFRI